MAGSPVFSKAFEERRGSARAAIVANALQKQQPFPLRLFARVVSYDEGMSRIGADSDLLGLALRLGRIANPAPGLVSGPLCYHGLVWH
jgi:hypothetical protein